jgi:hypothetical protein
MAVFVGLLRQESLVPQTARATAHAVEANDLSAGAKRHESSWWTKEALTVAKARGVKTRRPLRLI